MKTTQIEEFVIERAFDAPRALVWKAWAEAEHLARWWGPKGCKLEVARLEFRPGGFFHYAMKFPNGTTMWGRFLYRAIEPPESLAWLNSFSNETCGITRGPFNQSLPLEMLNTVTFAEQRGGTSLTLRSAPHGASDDERKVFVSLLRSMEQGYGGTFDQLGGYLAKL